MVTADDSQLTELKRLCEQAEKLRREAERLCQQIQARIDRTRVLAGRPERRRQPRSR